MRPPTDGTGAPSRWPIPRCCAAHRDQRCPAAAAPLRPAPRRSRIRQRRGTATARRPPAHRPPAASTRVHRQLAITVRPLPAVRDAAEAVRGWALADSGRPPVTGSHRAPGTLPIESWLLVGKRRQQVLLASLVAVGLLLVVIPMQQRDGTDVNPVNAAGAGAVGAPSRRQEAEEADRPGRRDRTPTAAPEAGRATAPAPRPSPPARRRRRPPRRSRAPAIRVPAGARARPSRCAPPASATVALTFDDGPDPVQTPKILALLAKYQVKATFCLVGEQVQKHPEIVRQIVAAGHTLCNHTWDHSLTIGKDKPAVIQADLARTNEAIRAAVPGAEIPFFRAPGRQLHRPAGRRWPTRTG